MAVIFIQDFAHNCGLPYIEVSAKENINIKEAFFVLARNIIAKKEGRKEDIPHLPYEMNDTKQLSMSRRQPDDKLMDTHQHSNNTPSHTQQSHSQIQETSTPEVHQELLPEKDASIQQELEQYKKRALEAEEKVEVLKAEMAQCQQQIEDKNQDIHRNSKRNQSLKERVFKLEENVKAAGQQLQEREYQVAKNLETIQDLESRLKQSEEAVRAARQEMREKEQQALRYTETNRTLENRVHKLEEEAAETQQHITELEQQLRQAELRLTNSDRIFQDIFQTLLGQLPQSQPYWVVQRNEIQLTCEELGTGGWASVKVALFRGQHVAAKCLHHQIISAHNIRLFTREMTMAARARHPNLLQFIGATMDNNPIILTELMPTSLRRILEQGVHLNHTQIISIASDVARALNYLHLNTPDPIIHRDISSANVLLEQFGDNYKAKVSDYGSANFSRYTSTAGPGNPLYSAPESGDPSRQSVKMDVYSFGLLLIEMCSGELFDDHEELIRTRINDWPEIVGIIRPCIRRDHKRRPNMDSVIAQLIQI